MWAFVGGAAACSAILIFCFRDWLRQAIGNQYDSFNSASAHSTNSATTTTANASASADNAYAYRPTERTSPSSVGAAAGGAVPSALDFDAGLDDDDDAVEESILLDARRT